jgi:hypothetical protein
MQSITTEDQNIPRCLHREPAWIALSREWLYIEIVMPSRLAQKEDHEGRGGRKGQMGESDRRESKKGPPEAGGEVFVK